MNQERYVNFENAINENRLSVMSPCHRSNSIITQNSNSPQVTKAP